MYTCGIFSYGKLHFRQGSMDIVISFINKINLFLWSGPMLILLCVTHLYFTFRTRFVQRHIGRAISCSLGTPAALPSTPSAKKHTTNSLRTLTTTLAATLGTGNIVGISTAVALGGAGAVFWCWLTGIFGMATTYAETFIGTRYQQILPDGTRLSGPMVAFHKRLNKPILSLFYSLCLLGAGLGMSATTSAVLQESGTELHVFPSDSFLLLSVCGILVAVFVGFIINGGGKTVTGFCMRLVPCMALFYFAACMLLLFLNRGTLLPALSLIVQSAFGLRPVGAGVLAGGMQLALRYGIARGLFTNEAGLGSAAVAASDSNDTPEVQGLVSMSATFWDTVVMCGLTGLLVISSALQGNFDPTALNSGELVHAAFSSLPFGRSLLNLSLCAFAVATLIGWYYIAEKAATQLSYLCYKDGTHFVTALRLFYMLSVFIGFLLSLDLIFAVSDLLNAVLTIPNVLLLYALRKEINSFCRPSSRHRS